MLHIIPLAQRTISLTPHSTAHTHGFIHFKYETVLVWCLTHSTESFPPPFYATAWMNQQHFGLCRINTKYCILENITGFLLSMYYHHDTTLYKYTRICDERPLMRDRIAVEDHLFRAVVLFDLVKYTSDKRLPLLKDQFLVASSVVFHCMFHWTCKKHNCSVSAIQFSGLFSLTSLQK